MGLDVIEIVMGIEEAFYIQIEDGDLEKVRTPRHLIELVQSKVTTVDSPASLTHRAFNSVRACLVRHGGFHRSKIVPAPMMINFTGKNRPSKSMIPTAVNLRCPLPFLIGPQKLKPVLF